GDLSAATSGNGVTFAARRRWAHRGKMTRCGKWQASIKCAAGQKRLRDGWGRYCRGGGGPWSGRRRGRAAASAPGAAREHAAQHARLGGRQTEGGGDGLGTCCVIDLRVDEDSCHGDRQQARDRRAHGRDASERLAQELGATTREQALVLALRH